MDRNRYSAVIHLVLSLLAVFIARDMLTSRPAGMIFFATIVFCGFFKAVIIKKICQEIDPSGKLEIAHNLCLAFIGLCWGLYWVNIEQFYGRFSIQSIFALVTISAFVSGSVNTQSPKPIGYLFFSFFLAVIPITGFFWQLDPDLTTMALGITLYMGFNLLQLRASHTTILRLFENDMQITHEREKLLSFINAVPGFVTIIDKDLKFILVNEETKRVFSGENFQNTKLDTAHPDSAFVNFVSTFMKSDKRSTVTEIEMLSEKGPIMTFTSIQKSDTLQGGAVIVAFPIKELIDSREIIKLQEAKNFQTAKLVSLGETAAGIAHEINNPLAIILGCSDQILRMLKRPEPDLARIEQTTKKIQTTVERISGIIKSLRILSRNGEKDPHSRVGIHLVLDHAIQLTKQRFRESGIDLVIVNEDKNIQCMGQEVQLLQVVMNLLSNAFDAASEGPAPRWVKVSTEICKDYIVLKVQDSGPGISKDLQARIMEPFFTTKPINKGTGLGLSISKSIIENHEGLLYLDENENQTTFIIRLKAAP